MPLKATDEQFIAAWREHAGHVAAVSKALDIGEPMVRRRRRSLEARYDISLSSRKSAEATIKANKAVIEHSIRDGVILVGSDCHYWPGEVSTAHRAFVHLARELKPAAVVLNGDVFDGASISRHPSIGWEKRPSVKQELDAVQERLGEIESAIGRAKRYWPAGNHDLRFESRLAQQAPEFSGINGIHLKDHFPRWLPCWRVDVNDDVVIKHRWANGLHAVYNNTLKSGKTIVTGHLHSLKVTPWTDYTGTRFGVDTGTMADPEGEQFVNYTEAGPKNWRSGFVVLTFFRGRLLWPEVVNVLDDERVEFRGKVLKV